MRRSLLLLPLLSIALAILALGSNASLPSSSGASTSGQCNIRLLIPEKHERAAIEFEDASLSFQGSGPLNPFIIEINGELATPNPIVSGCFDISLEFETQRTQPSGLLEMLVEPL